MQTKAELLSVFPVPFASYQDIADEITQEKGLYCLVCSNPTLLAFFLRFSNLVNLICVLLHFGRFLLFLRLKKILQNWKYISARSSLAGFRKKICNFGGIFAIANSFSIIQGCWGLIAHPLCLKRYYCSPINLFTVFKLQKQEIAIFMQSRSVVQWILKLQNCERVGQPSERFSWNSGLGRRSVRCAIQLLPAELRHQFWHTNSVQFICRKIWLCYRSRQFIEKFISIQFCSRSQLF